MVECSCFAYCEIITSRVLPGVCREKKLPFHLFWGRRYAHRDVWGKLDCRFVDQRGRHAIYGWIQNDARTPMVLTAQYIVA